ncbi:hypothetical protein L873DRAFT_823503 [Choiromyces venosus 120613-1]|uniref:Uncharacterized protein n=1 Tax=Choiromyces venosus 120613-1 TaxID=1336337 RepID=A0A3N4JPR6_9PEZI|nr:hypothetical protein L873DRAFT_823503 [Choiromyces venosus 120613-1]
MFLDNIAKTIYTVFTSFYLRSLTSLVTSDKISAECHLGLIQQTYAKYHPAPRYLFTKGPNKHCSFFCSICAKALCCLPSHVQANIHENKSTLSAAYPALRRRTRNEANHVMLNLLCPMQRSMLSTTKTAAIGYSKLRENITLLSNGLWRALWLSCIMPVSISHNRIFPENTPPDVVVCRPAAFSMLRSTAGMHCKDVGIRGRHSKP